MSESEMTSSRPYIMRALYEWIVDNHLTPYVLVDASVEGVLVPQQFVKVCARSNKTVSAGRVYHSAKLNVVASVVIQSLLMS